MARDEIAYQADYYSKNRVAINLRRLKFRRKNPNIALFKEARVRAKRKGLEFSIELADVYVPTHCPLLGIKLEQNPKRSGHSSPSLDRKNPRKGYVKGNVWVISNRANSAKNDLTLVELKTLVSNLELHYDGT